MNGNFRFDWDKFSVEDVILKSIEWIKNNRNVFYTASGTLAGIIILTIFFFVRYHTMKESSFEKLSYAQSMLFQGQAGQAVGMLDEIINKFSSSETAAQARLIKASYLFQQRNFVELEKTLQPLIDKNRPKYFVPMAISMLGAAQENMGKLDDAIKIYNMLLEKYPDHYLAAKTYESLARIYEIKKSVPEAVSNYEKLVNLYPNSGWAQRGQERLSMLTAAQQQAQPQPSVSVPGAGK